mgnify:FL=1
MYKFLEHTADFKIQVIANSLEEIFKESILALNAFLEPELGEKEKEEEITLQSPNLELLYIDFLSQILSKIYIEKMIFEVTNIDLNLKENSLVAKLKGREFKKIEKDIKAITYHQTKIEKIKDKYLAEFIIDV